MVAIEFGYRIGEKRYLFFIKIRNCALLSHDFVLLLKLYEKAKILYANNFTLIIEKKLSFKEIAE